MLNKKVLFRRFMVFSIICFFVGTAMSHALYSCIATTELTDLKNKKKIQKTNDKSEFANETEFPATGFFNVQKKDGIWWLVDPNGEKFYTIGIAYVSPGNFYYGNITDWVNKTSNKLNEWGFNTLNEGLVDLFPEMPYIYKLRFMDIVAEDEWTHYRMPDVFDTGWQNIVKNIINETANRLRNDSNLIGYQTDNEMKWGPNPVDDDTIIEVFMAANKTTAGKKKTVEFLRTRYNNDTNLFNYVWGMNIKDFNDLFNYKKFGKKGWKIRHGRAKEDIDSFSRFVARTYFNFTNSVLKNADPNHLNLGVRFFDQGVPIEVLEECGKYVDVISINYYRENILIYDPSVYLYSKLMDCVTLDNWMYKYHLITGKPLLSSEFSFIVKDILWPLFPNKDLIGRGLVSTNKYALTQEGKANLFEWYARKCLNAPYIVGHVWFSYMDKLNIEMGGIVNLWDEPHDLLVRRMAEVNKNAIELHENANYLYNTKKPSKTFFQFTLKSNQFSNLADEQNITNMQNEEIVYSSIEQESYPCNYRNNTLFVGGTGSSNYTNIQDAIDNASDRDLIYVYNGVYNEKLHINKSIMLQGKNRNETIIIGNYDVVKVDKESVVITISADNVKISGFTVTSDGGYFHDYFLRACSGISIDNCNNCTIEDNILKNLGNYGIRIRQSGSNRIKGNTIFNVLNKLGCNILIDSSKDDCIENNSLYLSTVCCIWVSRSIDINIQNNIVSNSFYCGIILESSNNTIIHRNMIEENLHTGILLRNSNNSIITSNNFKKEINHRQVFFFNSYDNNWDKNYWGRPQFFPKIVFGKVGKDGLTPTVAFDFFPVQEPYDIV